MTTETDGANDPNDANSTVGARDAEAQGQSEAEREILAGVITAIKAIAPEIEEADLNPQRSLREQVDLDSMDWLNVIVGLHQRFGVDIPESDYASLSSLQAIVGYLLVRTAGRPTALMESAGSVGSAERAAPSAQGSSG